MDPGAGPPGAVVPDLSRPWHVRPDRRAQAHLTIVVAGNLCELQLTGQSRPLVSEAVRDGTTDL